jgi:hypothetical protein
MNLNPLKLTAAMAGILTLTLAACGGGSTPDTGTPSTLTISGTAATGAAVAEGAVSVKCASGTGSATTNADGTYTVSIVGGTAPCLIKVTATDATGATTDLFSAIEPGQTLANVTPLTQMVVASALGADPATVFATGVDTSTAGNLSTDRLAAAVTTVQNVASSLGLDLSGIDPLKATLVAATDNTTGNTQDQVIDGLMAALSSAGLNLSNLTDAVKTATDSATAVTTLQTAATNAGTTLSTSSLAGCPAARSGGYFYAGPGDTRINKVVLNFGTTDWSIPDHTLATMTGWDFQNNAAVTIAQYKDTYDTSTSTYTPCAFKITTANSEVIEMHLTPAGLGAYADPNPSQPTTGVLLPVQKKLVVADLAGTLYGVKFRKSADLNGGKYVNRYKKLAIAADGNAKGWDCTADGTGLTCPADTDQPTETFTVAQADNGLFTFTDSSQVVHRIAIYVTNKGDRIAMAAHPTNGGDAFTFMSSRTTSIPVRSVGDTWSSWTWKTVNSPTAGLLSSSAVFNTYTVTSTTGSTLVRNDGTADDTLVYNYPLTGMAHKPSTGSTSGAYIFTGPGWSVSASDNPNAATGAKHFFNISVGLK